VKILIDKFKHTLHVS